jgi:Tfp pilus assembly protein PilO
MVSFFSIFALRPTLTTIASLQKAIESQNTLKTQISEKIETLTLAKNNYLAMDPITRESIDTLIPNETALPELINELRLLAQVYEASISGLQFETLDLDGKPKTLIRQPAPKEIPFTMNLKGEYITLLQFLDALNKIDRIISINSITVRGTEDDGLTMSINARAHYFKH